MHDVLATVAQHHDVAVAEFEKYLRVKEIHGPEKLVSHDIHDIRNALVSLQNKPTENPATSSYKHHVATEKVEGISPFCAATSSNGALPTPSAISECYLYHLVTWDEK